MGGRRCVGMELLLRVTIGRIVGMGDRMIFRFFQRNRSLPTMATRSYYSAEAFAALLEHERLRAERTERKFSLLEVTNRSGMDELPEVLRRIDHGAIRRTDATGEFRSGVGVLLPETDIEGALAVKEKLTCNLAADCRVYIFPTDDLPEDDPTNDGARTGAPIEPVAEPLENVMVLHSVGWKRCLDIIGAGVGLVVLSPIILIAMALVKLTSKGPVFFCQRRAGQGGVPFTMYKLRTMVVNAEELQAKLRDMSEQDGPAFKLKHDPRITPIGRLLRKSCIDELPQLWNILLGDMSIVGPRPLPLSESAQIAPWARTRLRVKPGLTCIWQVDGGPHVKFDDWMRMDIQYILEQNTTSDLRLIAQTAANVLMHRAST